MANVVEREPVVEVVDSAIPAWQRRTIQEVTDYQCKYPVGDPKDPDFFFCGAPIREGEVYCTAHYQRCYMLNFRHKSLHPFYVFPKKF